MVRGRQAGYHNYSDKEELLLCDVAAKFVPIGRNMWESVAVEYNSSKERSWAARDFDSLRRKFCKLYAKPKPTGNQGDNLPRRLRAVLLAHEVQYAIECKGGAHTSHNGPDNGADDNQLLDEVNSALNGDDDQPQHARAGLAPVQGGDHPLGQPNDDDVSNTSPSPDEISGTPNSNFVEDPSAPLILQVAPNSGGRADSTGTVATSQGFVPVEFAADYDVESSDEDSEEQDSHSVESSELVGVALTDNGPDGTSNATITATPTPPGATSAPTQSTMKSGTPTSSTPRGVGRPRVRDASPIVSMASPDGSALSRNPERVASDAAEAERFRRMKTTLRRWGGRTAGAKSKRPATESPAPPTYAATKRQRAKKRMEALEKELREAELASASTGSEMKELLLLFREDGDRRADAEAKLRREEREERRLDEKRERDEREHVRRVETAAVEARRQQDREDETNKRDAAQRKEEAEHAERREEEAERRRQFEARLELDRSEARQRHEQMLLLISSMQKSK
ncbi:hypothetical protein PR002_g21854 [Phytophthora rubi]|uniref:DUF6818 domain-containing protein n=1 Tax=Phytophthora rubi TaxID=129364 RepID=A0A6A3J721_9STRA|nr:hypothetical protein PR002_g21854 [Phytophthora rubi]